MYLSEQLQEKWGAVLNHSELPEIKDSYKKAVTSVLLENQERALREDRNALNETAPVNNSFATSGIDRYDPILIGLVRRSMPNLIAYDIAGVQPMTGPTGLIFAMRSMYGAERAANTRVEALFNEADTDFSSSGFDSSYAGTAKNGTHAGDNPVNGTYTTGGGMTTAEGEALGDNTSTNNFGQMSFSIDKTTVTAKSRALKAEYTLELAQDLKDRKSTRLNSSH